VLGVHVTSADPKREPTWRPVAKPRVQRPDGEKQRRKTMTKTEENLKAAFTGESQARNKYTFFAEIARKEGYHYIAKIFEETAENEKYHALEEFKLLYGDQTTLANLREAIGGENYESEEMYPRFAKEASLEGNKAAAILFTQIAKIEKQHKARFKKLLDMVESGSVYKRKDAIKWKCSVCGYTYEGKEPPPRCPYCKHPKEYYEPANLDV
jgi:rubrerythrin